MTGHAYATSARTAGRMGPFAGYADNADAMLDVLRMHRADAQKIDRALVLGAYEIELRSLDFVSRCY